MLTWGYRVILLIGLIWGHFLTGQTTLFVGTAQSKGIEAITAKPIPLSADDLARGLLAHPTKNINPDVLRQTQETRYILSQQQDELRRIRRNQQQQALRLLQNLETP